jgi:hypothetical protein
MTHYGKLASTLLLLLALTPATLAGGLPEEVSMGLMVYRDGSVSLHGSFNLTLPTPVYGSAWVAVEVAGNQTSFQLQGNITQMWLNKSTGTSSGHLRLELSVESAPSGSVVETRGWLSLVLKERFNGVLIDVALNLSNLASRYDPVKRVLNVSGEIDISGYCLASIMNMSAAAEVIILEDLLPSLVSRLNLTDAVSLNLSSTAQGEVGVLYFKADVDVGRLINRPPSNLTPLIDILVPPYSSSIHGLLEASANESSISVSVDFNGSVGEDVNRLIARFGSLAELLSKTLPRLIPHVIVGGPDFTLNIVVFPSPMVSMLKLPNSTTSFLNLLMGFSRAFRILDSEGSITAVFEGEVVRVEFNTPRIVGWNATSTTETLKALHDFIYQAYASLPQAMGAKTPVGKTLTFRVEAEPGVVVELNGTQVSEVALDDLPNLQVSTQAQANTTVVALGVGVVAVLTGLTAFLLLWRRHRKIA